MAASKSLLIPADIRFTVGKSLRISEDIWKSFSKARSGLALTGATAISPVKSNEGNPRISSVKVANSVGQDLPRSQLGSDLLESSET